MKAILFDLDDTLYPYIPCHENGLLALTEFLKNEWNLIQDDAKNIYLKARDLVQIQLKNLAASHHRLLYMIRICELLGKNPIRYAKELEQIYWNSYFEKMKLFEGVLELFQVLKARHIKLAIVTDLVTEIQYKKLNHLGLTDLIDVVVTSEEAGIEKPSSIIFQLALEKLQISSKREVVMVGDSYSKDIVGAKEFGILAYWFRGDPEKVSEFIIPFQNIEELKLLLLNNIN